MQVLVVDDNEHVREPIRGWFEAHGIKVHVAEDGVAAVEKCAQYAYDAVLMDLDMPRMNGWEAARILKGMRPNLPVIVLTGARSVPGRGIECAVAKVLRKPMALSDLENEVRQVCDGRG